MAVHTYTVTRTRAHRRRSEVPQAVAAGVGRREELHEVRRQKVNFSVRDPRALRRVLSQIAPSKYSIGTGRKQVQGESD